MTRSRNPLLLTVIAVVVTIVATMDTSRAAAPFSYTKHNVRGTYRITFTGLSLPSLTPHSGIGIFEADGGGNITGTEVLNQGGVVCADVAVKGTYDVGGNGIGTMSATYASPTPGCSGDFTLALLVLQGGDAVKALAVSQSFVTLSQDWIRD